jgi:hypothetical protein
MTCLLDHSGDIKNLFGKVVHTGVVSSEEQRAKHNVGMKVNNSPGATRIFKNPHPVNR